MNTSNNSSLPRLFLSYFAAVVSVVVVLAEHHVYFDFADPGTYTSPFEHKCGLMMIACLGWAAIETVWLLSEGLRDSVGVFVPSGTFSSARFASRVLR